MKKEVKSYGSAWKSQQKLDNVIAEISNILISTGSANNSNEILLFYNQN